MKNLTRREVLKADPFDTASNLSAECPCFTGLPFNLEESLP